MRDYAHPDALVSTGWVHESLGQPRMTVVEVDADMGQYGSGHIPGAVAWDWRTQLQDQLSRDIIDASTFERLMSDSGIEPRDTVVLYGDHRNGFAAYAFWLLKYYGHDDVRLLNGGRTKWVAERRPLSTETPAPARTGYRIMQTYPHVRARISEVIQNVNSGGANLIDARAPEEFAGAVSDPIGAQRAGHIPRAVNLPWDRAVNSDGTFKDADELAQIYLREAGLVEGKPSIAYCRIGERSSHTWFVLKYLLGLPDVKNYDGSWTEYGNLVGVPIEKGSAEVTK